MKNILIFVGPSGSGKTLLSHYLKEEFGAVEFISTTSREKRIGEKNHEDYHFTSEDEFKKKVEKGEFIEYSNYAGNYYGLTKESVYETLKNHNFCAAVMDIKGACKIKLLFEDDKDVSVHLIFVHAKLSTLFLRMVERGDNNEKIAERLDNIIEDHELFNGGSCDFTIFNDQDVDYAKRELRRYVEKILENGK